MAQLHSEVQRIAEAVVFVDGKADIPDESLRHIAARLQAQPQPLREPIAMDLVVVARRMLEQAPMASTRAIGKLMALTAVLLASAEQAAELFEKAGVNTGAARKALGIHGPDWQAVAQQENSGEQPGLLGLLGKKDK